jgi:hypothetical protein
MDTLRYKNGEGEVTPLGVLRELDFPVVVSLTVRPTKRRNEFLHTHRTSPTVILCIVCSPKNHFSRVRKHAADRSARLPRCGFYDVAGTRQEFLGGLSTFYAAADCCMTAAAS